MQETIMRKVIRLCCEIDETACKIYSKLSKLYDDETLSKFWAEMSKEEGTHVSFWKRAKKIDAISGIPIPFEKPDEVVAELNRDLLRSQDLLNGLTDDFEISKAFSIAYRMEFYLMHPAFTMLFHLLGPTVGGLNIEEEYESHIAGFITMLEKYGNVTPELELLGEALKRLWKENRYLTLQATRDELTGAYNRRGFFSAALQFAHISQRTGSTAGIIMIDIDHFKAINDRFGHSAGDLALIDTVKFLIGSLRKSDIIGRYGGEEFIVMLPKISKGATAKVAEKLRNIVEVNSRDKIPLTISLGFVETVFGMNVQEDFNRFIHMADTALYKAKTSGRNKVIEFAKDADAIPKVVSAEGY